MTETTKDAMTKSTDSAVIEAQTDDRPVVLKVEHVAKSFRLPTEQATGIKMAFLNWTRGIKGYTEQHVLRDINFEVKQGDFFGIVGRNGSGKSTLLKIISQIYKPEKGKVTVKGKLVPFIELGVGFNPELTGRENVYLNGALLGFTHEEIDAMYDDIVEFAELGDFMDQKLKNYSSGMQVRLAFSVAIKAQGDILVLDEVLAVGDEAFQRKCDNFFSQIKKDSTKTVILVTHSMESVKKYCNKAILIKDGEIVVSGNKDDVADQYTLENLKVQKKEQDKNVVASEGKYPAGLSERVPLLKVKPVDSLLARGDSFKFAVEYIFDGPSKFFIGITMLDTKRGGIVYDTGGQDPIVLEPGHHVVEYVVPIGFLNNGEYRLTANLRTIDDSMSLKSVKRIAYTNENNVTEFAIRDEKRRGGFALINESLMEIRLNKYVE